MEEFVLKIDPEKFRATNECWNQLRLNDPWSVGYVSLLIESETFNTKEDWEKFYFESGVKRNFLIEKLPDNIKDALRKYHPADASIGELSLLNYNYGRTEVDFKEKSKILRSNADFLDENEAYECVRFRVICETWNGIILRERNTLKTLKAIFSDEVSLIKTSGEFDHRYGVDYECLKNNVKLFGIQIKPESYLFGDNVYINRAKKANKDKNAQYEKDFNIPVHTLTASQRGILTDESNKTVVNLSTKYFLI